MNNYSKCSPIWLAIQSAFFAGNGTLTLIPEPTWVMTIVGASLLLGAQRFRRRTR